MAKWANSNVLDSGPEYIRTLAGSAGRVKLHVIKAYSAGDSYSTVVTTNSVGVVDLAVGDLVMSSSGSNRVLTVASKSISAASANSGASPDLHIAIVDSTGSAVLLVTDETSNQVITSGNPITTPSFTYTINQPT